MPSNSDKPALKLDFSRATPTNALHLQMEGESDLVVVNNLSVHGFDLDSSAALLGVNGIRSGELGLGDQPDSIPIKFRARHSDEGFRCTLVDLNLDEQESIEQLIEKLTIEETSEFDDLSYDELAGGGAVSSRPKAHSKSKSTDKPKSEPTTERRGAIAAILCAIGLTAAIAVIASIVLGRSSLDVYNGALVGNYLPISSSEEGTIAEMFVNAGDQVKKGTPLFRIYNREQSKLMESLQTELARAVAEFDAQERQLQAFGQRLQISSRAVQKDIEIASAELAQVEVDLKHAKALAANLAPLLRRKAISKIEYQAAVASRDSLEQQVLIKKATIGRLQVSLDAITENNITVGSGGQFDDRANQLAMQRDIAQAAVNEAHRKIEFQNLQMADQTAFATDTGIVYGTYRSPGEFVKPGDPIVSLSLKDTNWAIGHITPDDALRVRPGQRVYVSIPSLDIETEGTIATVGHRGVYSNGGGWSNDFRSDPINIPIKVNLPEATSELPSGLRLKMAVALERHWPWEKPEYDLSPTVPAPINEDGTTALATKH